MTVTNDFKPFATGVGANVATQAAWVASGQVTQGFTSGVAPSAMVNKALRQSSFIGAALAQLVADSLQMNVSDNGALTTFEQMLGVALSVVHYGIDTGVPNAYAATYNVPVFQLVDGLNLRFRAINTNTGPSSFAANGLQGPIYSIYGIPLTGGEIPAGGTVEVTWNSVMNSGNGAWVLTKTPGGLGAGRSNFVQQSNVNLAANQTYTNSLTFTAPANGQLFAMCSCNRTTDSASLAQQFTLNGTMYGHSYASGSLSDIMAASVTAGTVYTIQQALITNSTAPTYPCVMELGYIFNPA